MYICSKCGVRQVYYSVEVCQRKKRPWTFLNASMFFGLVVLNVLLISYIALGYDVNDIYGILSSKRSTDKNDKVMTIDKSVFSIKKKEEQKFPFYIGMPSPVENKTEKAYESKNIDMNLKKESTVTESVYPKPEKVAYLTFDDGPSVSITPKVLKILDDNNIKATFFVLGEMCSLNPEILKEVQKKGHLICNHTYTHEYKSIYKSKEAFMNELKLCEDTIVSILGSSWDSNKFIRFPGGSFDKKFDSYKIELKNRGYRSFDWNALNGDAEGINVPKNKLIQNIVKTTKNNNKALILMHDSAGKETTAEALPDIIKYLKDNGYVFETLKTYR